jgi:hypothetical protein
MGFGPGAVDTAAPEVWPCVAPAVQLLVALGTQWRMAPMGGAVGLDYGAVRPTLQLLGVPRAQWGELFKDLQVMEAAAVKAMRGDTDNAALGELESV